MPAGFKTQRLNWSAPPGLTGLYWVRTAGRVTNSAAALGSRGSWPGSVVVDEVGVVGLGGGAFDFSAPACLPALEPDPDAGVNAVPDGSGVGGGLAAAA